ncbi:MAG: hypothetical protein KGR26_07950, partial [Cyanobacteria bacterium REEB65]|nr:hypothetical protein [Cyanobacteria bacterium REEB65]
PSDSYGNGGGGSGGSIYLAAASMSLASNVVTAPGGAGGTGANAYGGNGGFGRVRLVYSTLNGTSYPNSPAESAAIPSGTPISDSAPQGSFSNFSSAIVQSLGYDTQTTAPLYVSANPAVTYNGGTASFQYSASADNANWSAWTANVASLPSYRYVRWQATLTGSAVVNSVSITYGH